MTVPWRLPSGTGGEKRKHGPRKPSVHSGLGQPSGGTLLRKLRHATCAAGPSLPGMRGSANPWPALLCILRHSSTGISDIAEEARKR